jgi:hypothetical protein
MQVHALTCYGQRLSRASAQRGSPSRSKPCTVTSWFQEAQVRTNGCNKGCCCKPVTVPQLSAAMLCRTCSCKTVPPRQFWQSTAALLCPRRPGHILHIQYILTYPAYNVYNSVWLLHCLVGCVPVHHCPWAQWINTSLVYCSSVLHTLVPVFNTGTIPKKMLSKSADFPGASCYETKDSKDGCRWWYMYSWALVWGKKQWWKASSLRNLWLSWQTICQICNYNFWYAEYVNKEIQKICCKYIICNIICK